MVARRTGAIVSTILGLALTGMALPASAQVAASRNVNVAVDAELEPGAVYVGTWGSLHGAFQTLLARPRDEDAEVIAEVRAMGDAAPPPFLMEMGRRLAATDPVEGSYWYRLGVLRAQWASFSCADETAPQGLRILLFEIDRAEPGIVARFDAPALRLPALERLGNGDVVFEGTASAWWICSHGVGAINAGLGAVPGERAVLPLSTWRKPESERNQMATRLRDYLPRWIASDREALEKDAGQGE